MVVGMTCDSRQTKDSNSEVGRICVDTIVSLAATLEALLPIIRLNLVRSMMLLVDLGMKALRLLHHPHHMTLEGLVMVAMLRRRLP